MQRLLKEVRNRFHLPGSSIAENKPALGTQPDGTFVLPEEEKVDLATIDTDAVRLQIARLTRELEIASQGHPEVLTLFFELERARTILERATRMQELHRNDEQRVALLETSEGGSADELARNHMQAMDKAEVWQRNTIHCQGYIQTVMDEDVVNPQQNILEADLDLEAFFPEGVAVYFECAAAYAAGKVLGVRLGQQVYFFNVREGDYESEDKLQHRSSLSYVFSRPLSYEAEFLRETHTYEGKIPGMLIWAWMGDASGSQSVKFAVHGNRLINTITRLTPGEQPLP